MPTDPKGSSLSSSGATGSSPSASSQDSSASDNNSHHLIESLEPAAIDSRRHCEPLCGQSDRYHRQQHDFQETPESSLSSLSLYHIYDNLRITSNHDLHQLSACELRKCCQRLFEPPPTVLSTNTTGRNTTAINEYTNDNIDQDQLAPVGSNKFINEILTNVIEQQQQQQQRSGYMESSNRETNYVRNATQSSSYCQLCCSFTNVDKCRENTTDTTKTSAIASQSTMKLQTTTDCCCQPLECDSNNGAKQLLDDDTASEDPELKYIWSCKESPCSSLTYLPRGMELANEHPNETTMIEYQNDVQQYNNQDHSDEENFNRGACKNNGQDNNDDEDNEDDDQYEDIEILPPPPSLPFGSTFDDGSQQIDDDRMKMRMRSSCSGVSSRNSSIISLSVSSSLLSQVLNMNSQTNHQLNNDENGDLMDGSMNRQRSSADKESTEQSCHSNNRLHYLSNYYNRHQRPLARQQTQGQNHELSPGEGHHQIDDDPIIGSCLLSSSPSSAYSYNSNPQRGDDDHLEESSSTSPSTTCCLRVTSDTGSNGSPPLSSTNDLTTEHSHQDHHKLIKEQKHKYDIKHQVDSLLNRRKQIGNQIQQVSSLDGQQKQLTPPLGSSNYNNQSSFMHDHHRDHLDADWSSLSASIQGHFRGKGDKFIDENNNQNHSSLPSTTAATSCNNSFQIDGQPFEAAAMSCTTSNTATSKIFDINHQSTVILPLIIKQKNLDRSISTRSITNSNDNCSHNSSISNADDGSNGSSNQPTTASNNLRQQSMQPVAIDTRSPTSITDTGVRTATVRTDHRTPPPIIRSNSELIFRLDPCSLPHWDGASIIEAYANVADVVGMSSSAATSAVQTPIDAPLVINYHHGPRSHPHHHHQHRQQQRSHNLMVSQQHQYQQVQRNRPSPRPRSSISRASHPSVLPESSQSHEVQQVEPIYDIPAADPILGPVSQPSSVQAIRSDHPIQYANIVISPPSNNNNKNRRDQYKNESSTQQRRSPKQYKDPLAPDQKYPNSRSSKLTMNSQTLVQIEEEAEFGASSSHVISSERPSHQIMTKIIHHEPMGAKRHSFDDHLFWLKSKRESSKKQPHRTTTESKRRTDSKMCHCDLCQYKKNLKLYLRQLDWSHNHKHHHYRDNQTTVATVATTTTTTDDSLYSRLAMAGTDQKDEIQPFAKCANRNHHRLGTTQAKLPLTTSPSGDRQHLIVPSSPTRGDNNRAKTSTVAAKHARNRENSFVQLISRRKNRKKSYESQKVNEANNKDSLCSSCCCSFSDGDNDGGTYSRSTGDCSCSCSTTSPGSFASSSSSPSSPSLRRQQQRKRRGNDSVVIMNTRDSRKVKEKGLGDEGEHGCCDDERAGITTSATLSSSCHNLIQTSGGKEVAIDTESLKRRREVRRHYADKNEKAKLTKEKRQEEKDKSKQQRDVVSTRKNANLVEINKLPISNRMLFLPKDVLGHPRHNVVHQHLSQLHPSHHHRHHLTHDQMNHDDAAFADRHRIHRHHWQPLRPLTKMNTDGSISRINIISGSGKYDNNYHHLREEGEGIAHNATTKSTTAESTRYEQKPKTTRASTIINDELPTTTNSNIATAAADARTDYANNRKKHNKNDGDEKDKAVVVEAPSSRMRLAAAAIRNELRHEWSSNHVGQRRQVAMVTTAPATNNLTTGTGRRNTSYHDYHMQQFRKEYSNSVDGDDDDLFVVVGNDFDRDCANATDGQDSMKPFRVYSSKSVTHASPRRHHNLNRHHHRAATSHRRSMLAPKNPTTYKTGSLRRHGQRKQNKHQTDLKKSDQRRATTFDYDELALDRRRRSRRQHHRIITNYQSSVYSTSGSVRKFPIYRPHLSKRIKGARTSDHGSLMIDHQTVVGAKRKLSRRRRDNRLLHSLHQRKQLRQQLLASENHQLQVSKKDLEEKKTAASKNINWNNEQEAAIKAHVAANMRSKDGRNRCRCGHCCLLEKMIQLDETNKLIAKLTKQQQHQRQLANSMINNDISVNNDIAINKYPFLKQPGRQMKTFTQILANCCPIEARRICC